MMKNLNRILLIDDDEDLLFLLEKKIQVAGYQTRACWNGQDWEDVIRSFAPGLILIDITMSDHDGGELCHKIKMDPRYAHIKVYLMSGIANVEQVVAQCGADGIIRKPIDFTIIQNVLHKELS